MLREHLCRGSTVLCFTIMGNTTASIIKFLKKNSKASTSTIVGAGVASALRYKISLGNNFLGTIVAGSH